MSTSAVVVGIGTAGFEDDDLDLAIDEITFAATSAALRDARIGKAAVDLSVVASIDVFDGQSMSNGVTTPAAAGWLTGDYRVEADAGVALASAAAMIRAGSAEVAVVVGVHWPGYATEPSVQSAETSSVSLEPGYERSLGLTSAATLGLHAQFLIEQGCCSRDELSKLTARELGRGGHAIAHADVLAASPVAWPLTLPMISRPVNGAAAVVLAAAERACFTGRARAVLAGQGVSNGGSLSTGEWLMAPEEATRRAAAAAYARAGIVDVANEIETVELTAASAALFAPVRAALGAAEVEDTRINPVRGALGGCAGAATGALRVADALSWLDAHGRPGSRAVVHTADDLTGTVASTATVHVLEVL